jgi:PilZ domain
MDRRSDTRFGVNTACQITRPRKKRNVMVKTTQNISGSGILIRWNPEDTAMLVPRVGESIDIDVALPPHPVFGQKSMHMKAQIVRVTKEEDNTLLVAGRLSKKQFRKFTSAA